MRSASQMTLTRFDPQKRSSAALGASEISVIGEGMDTLSIVSDPDLLARMPGLVLAERARSADVIEHLVEIDRRRLFLDQACRSLSCYCIERLGYSEDEAGKRVRVARLARRFPRLLDELRAGSIHLTGLALLAQYLTEENCEV